MAHLREAGQLRGRDTERRGRVVAALHLPLQLGVARLEELLKHSVVPHLWRGVMGGGGSGRRGATHK